ncbi:MAG TPA: hypothetical protein PKU94_06080 [Candidatus Hydrothermia bacterium]|nr:hypothetical protein [Candidatus Hydrothermia bacterium]
MRYEDVYEDLVKDILHALWGKDVYVDGVMKPAMNLAEVVKKYLDLMDEEGDFAARVLIMNEVSYIFNEVCVEALTLVDSEDGDDNGD